VKKLLHAGCATTPLPPWFDGLYDETRLDIDPAMEPDIVASLTDMSAVPDSAFDVVYTSHCVEHLYPSEVQSAMSEFHRVTAPGGSVIVIVPDLQDVPVSDEPLFESPVGWLSGLDLIYGCRYDAERSRFMAHHSGFTASLLERVMRDAGFNSVTMKRLPDYNLMGVAQKCSN
jgi:ubiquinone/menaquinone biosynthesis C-methylase UbiE